MKRFYSVLLFLVVANSAHANDAKLRGQYIGMVVGVLLAAGLFVWLVRRLKKRL